MLGQHLAGMMAWGRFRYWQTWRGFPETIRGFGHVEEENIGKAIAERARLEADLENNRFAAAAE